jgi:DNA-binding NtrC family response regulator
MLIVDDERVITDSLVKIFRNEGYETCGVHSAEEARDLLSSWVPDFAIVDVRLPNMNGVDLAILIKAEYPQCRLILFSGEMTTTDVLDAARKDGHIFDVVAKPVHPLEFIRWAAADGSTEVRRL